MSEEFFPGLSEHIAEQQKQKNKTYSVRMLKKIIKSLAPERLNEMMSEAGSDFGLDWFNDTQHPPVLLAAKKLTGATLSNLLSKNFLTGEIAKAYFEEYESYGAIEIGKQIGVIFPIDSSPWVITDAQLEIRGSAYMQFHGGSDDVPTISAVRLDDFIDGWKRQGFVI